MAVFMVLFVAITAEAPAAQVKQRRRRTAPSTSSAASAFTPGPLALMQDGGETVDGDTLAEPGRRGRVVDEAVGRRAGSPRNNDAN